MSPALQCYVSHHQRPARLVPRRGGDKRAGSGYTRPAGSPPCDVIASAPTAARPVSAPTATRPGGRQGSPGPAVDPVGGGRLDHCGVTQVNGRRSLPMGVLKVLLQSTGQGITDHTEKGNGSYFPALRKKKSWNILEPDLLITPTTSGNIFTSG